MSVTPRGANAPGPTITHLAPINAVMHVIRAEEGEESGFEPARTY